MTLLQIQSFLALAENLSFTKAARQLSLSQSTMSMHIMALEKNLDIRLFIRSKKRVDLSPEGEIMYHTFKNALSNIETGLQDARELHRSHADIIRIGYLQGLNTDIFFNEIIDRYRKTHQNIILELVRLNNNDIIKGLDKHVIDIGFTLKRVQRFRPDFNWGSVYEAPVSIIRANVRGHGDAPLTTSCLNGETFIVLSQDADPTEKSALTKILDICGITPGDMIEASSVESQMLNVELGMGAALSNHMSKTYLKSWSVSFDVPGVMTECVWLSRKDHQNPIVRQFEEYLVN
jgi:DNA-binding transcriptional LysR family regulator